MSKKVYGNINNLKASTIKKLESIYTRTVHKDEIVSTFIAKQLNTISREINKIIAVIIDRKGKIVFVIVGDSNKVFIPDLGRFRSGGNRFRGLRLFHTRLNYEELNIDDLTDLYKLKLDMVSVLTMTPNGDPDLIYSATIEPSAKESYRYLDPVSIHEININFLNIIKEIEEDFNKKVDEQINIEDKENAIIIYVSNKPRNEINSSIEEIKALAYTAGVNVLRVVIQRKKTNPKTIIGLGKLDEILLLSNKLNCNLLIFNHTLSPAQLRTLTNYLDEKIIDRNMLILDIFAQRAKSNDGKIQVELAQLKYLSTRLAERANALSRLTGGIGGRGPGESKLEVDKRRIEKRIKLLSDKLKKIETKRNLQRKKRISSDSMIISLLGYTNVGKSTLLNRITKSNAIVEDKLFATLDTTSKSLVYNNKKLIISDTVGFIKELPKELFQAFKATIEEIKFSNLILHVVDPSDDDYLNKMKSVNKILEDLKLINSEIIYVFNKIDLISEDELNFLKRLYPRAIFTSAKKDFNFIEFIERISMIL